MKWFFFLALFACTLCADDYVIDLKEPRFDGEQLVTNQGGVVKGPKIRVQAQTIKYVPGKTIEAHGNLLVEYGGRYLTGDHLIYNFVTSVGMITNCHVNVGIWFFSGERVRLNPDESVTIAGAAITTSESCRPEWDVKAKYVQIKPGQELFATNVLFRLYQLPIFYLPALTSSLTKSIDSPVRYKLSWDKGQGVKLSMRYRIFSNEELDIFLRGDIRTSRGFGGAIESTYLSPNKRTLFQTKNYLAHDTFFFDDDPNKKRTRYRLQGIYTHQNDDASWLTFARWDRFSDKNMPRDFKSDDFELNTARRTELLLRNFGPRHIMGLNVRPRINSFQGFRQELPLLNLSLRPFELGTSGIISENVTRSGYFDYVYSDDIEGILPDFEAIHLKTHHFLYRPISLNVGRLTPLVGFEGIYYSDSPGDKDVGQALFHYGGEFQMPFVKHFQTARHELIPFVSYRGLLKPTISPNEVFIFDIADGVNRLNLLTPGLKTHIYTDTMGPFLPALSANLYGLCFFSEDTFSKRLPKAYLDLKVHRPRLSLFANIGWNFQENLLDRANLHLLLTINAKSAFNLEYRHRSRFDWRKDNHDNYYLDVTRPISELARSPLSDGRNTILSRLQFKLEPNWTLRFESQSGFGRGKEPGYTQFRVQLLSITSTGWELALSLEQTVRGPRFAGVRLIKQ